MYKFIYVTLATETRNNQKFFREISMYRICQNMLVMYVLNVRCKCYIIWNDG